ncbi:MAG: TetR/AcrR family transcriptional regulator [Anaerolineales bacterium]
MPEEPLSKGERTRLAIQDAAYELFLEQGYSATSMRQIAKRAGVAVGGIYNHFASKDAIFEAIIFDRHPYKQIIPLIAVAPGDTAEEFIRNAARALVDELKRRPDFLKLMFIEIVEFNTKHVSKLMAEIIPQILPLIQRIRSRPESVRPIHPAIILRAFLGMFFSYYITEMMAANVMPADMRENSLDVFVDIFLHGILSV